MVGSARLNPRARLREAESRATTAAAAEREAAVIAAVASALLADPAAGPEQRVIQRISADIAPAGLRLELKHTPRPKAAESALPLRLRSGSGWLYANREAGWEREDAERIGRRLAELLNQSHDAAARTDTVAETETRRRVELAKSSILSAISGNLVAPLTAIKTAAGELSDSQLGEEDRRRLAEAIVHEAAQLDRIAADLRDLSAIAERTVKRNPEPCDVNETMRRAVAAVQSERGGHDIQFSLRSDLPRVHADCVQLERVFTSLVDNAVRFSPPGGSVEVRAAAANGRVTIRVIDRGRGIPGGSESQIFEPFVRTGGQGETGAAIGLAICRGFVEANGGRISVQSQARDGTAFAVSFPIAEPSAVS